VLNKTSYIGPHTQHEREKKSSAAHFLPKSNSQTSLWVQFNDTYTDKITQTNNHDVH